MLVQAEFANHSRLRGDVYEAFIDHYSGRARMARKPSLTELTQARRDEIVTRINGKKRFVVTQEEPQGAVRAEGYNAGLDDAIKIVMELI